MKKKSLLILLLTTGMFVVGGVIETAEAYFGGYYNKTNNSHSVTMPDGNVFRFVVHDYFRFSSRATLPDGTVVDGEGDVPPPIGSRIRFRVPADFYSSSRWNAQRADTFVNLGTALVGWGATAPTRRIHSTTINDTAYSISGSLRATVPTVNYVKSGSLYGCSGSSTEQTCTYGGGRACFTFRVPRPDTSANYSFSLRTQYGTLGASAGSRSGSITDMPTTGNMTYFFNTNSCGSFKKCSDGLDNDGDGRVDMSDSACSGPDDDSEAPQCADDSDNDGDGKTDFDGSGVPANKDPECVDANDDSEAPQCSDLADNDSDGLIDTADPGCHQDNDLAKPYNPNDNDEVVLPICSDTVDNDGDGLVDAADPGCHQDNDLTKPNDPNDNDETNPVVIPAPRVTGPTLGTKDVRYTFTAQSDAFGAVDKQYQYGFDWGSILSNGSFGPPDGIVDAWTLPPVLEGQPGSESFEWSVVGNPHTFKVMTRDSDGVTSDWTAHSITISDSQNCSADDGKKFWSGCSASCGGGTRIEYQMNTNCSVTPTGNTETCNNQACGSEIIEVPVGGP